MLIVTRENFPEIYENYKNTVFSIAYSYLKDHEDAMDVTQDSFIKLLQANKPFSEEEHIKAWLLRVAINLSKNLLRTSKHRSYEEISEDLPYWDKTGNNELLKYVLELPEKYRIVIHLFYYEDYSVKEIAQIMRLSESAVKVRLNRGREKLAYELVKEDWNE